tara:strand:- start:102 stop:590 length:489 start_codon:yes stop_codon:yes gene_type:complete
VAAKYTLGIDPGMKGGWAVTEKGTGLFAGGGRMPTKAYGKRRQVDVIEWHRQLQALAGEVTTCCIEMVWSSPQMGVASAFSFGLAQGAALAFAQGYGLEPTLVTPQMWKGWYVLRKDKQASLDLCEEMWPEHEKIWSVKANDGIAEAALIARWLDSRKTNEI